MLDPFKFLPFKTFCVALTYRCNIECAHCVCNCAPSRSEVMQADDCRRILREIVALKPELIVASGGEALLYPSLVNTFLDSVAGSGIPVGVQTNASWAVTESGTSAVVDRLRSSGAAIMVVSTDEYHVPFVPIERVARLIRVCNRADMPVRLQVSCHAESCFLREMIPVLAGCRYHLSVQSITPFGRGQSLPERCIDPDARGGAGPCRSTDTCFIEPGGDVYGCCGPALHFAAPHLLYLGNARQTPLQEVLRRGYCDPLLTLLRLAGHFTAMTLLRARGAREMDQPRFPHLCRHCESFVAAAQDERWREMAADILGDSELVTRCMLARIIVFRRISKNQSIYVSRLLGLEGASDACSQSQ